MEVALGKLLLSAAVMGVLEPALTVAAGLNIQVGCFSDIELECVSANFHACFNKN